MGNSSSKNITRYECKDKKITTVAGWRRGSVRAVHFFFHMTLINMKALTNGKPATRKKFIVFLLF